MSWNLTNNIYVIVPINYKLSWFAIFYDLHFPSYHRRWCVRLCDKSVFKNDGTHTNYNSYYFIQSRAKNSAHPIFRGRQYNTNISMKRISLRGIIGFVLSSYIYQIDNIHEDKKNRWNKSFLIILSHNNEWWILKWMAMRETLNNGQLKPWKRENISKYKKPILYHHQMVKSILKSCSHLRTSPLLVWIVSSLCNPLLHVDSSDESPRDTITVESDNLFSDSDIISSISAYGVLGIECPPKKIRGNRHFFHFFSDDKNLGHEKHYGTRIFFSYSMSILGIFDFCFIEEQCFWGMVRIAE